MNKQRTVEASFLQQQVPYDMQHLQRWVEDLPLSDLDNASKELYAAIKKVTQGDTDAEMQIQSFDILRPAIKQTCSSLAQGLLNQCVQLSQAQIHSSKLAHMLQLYLFSGYKHSLEQFQQTREDNKNSLLAQAIHRSLSEALDVLVFNYQLYSQISNELWAEINALYALAEELNLHNFPVEDSNSQFAKQSTILQLMVRVQLLVLAQPYRLRRADIALVNQALEHWSRYVYFGHKKMPAALFKVDIKQRTPPESCSTPTHSHSMRYIDISNLIAHLNTDLKHEVIIPEGMDSYLLAYLCRSWSKPPKRCSYRNLHAGQVSACIGLYATHFYCSTKELATSTHSTDGAYQIHKVQTKNISANGFGLIWHEALPPSINVGELIAIRFGEHQDWLMGVIRWIKIHSAQHIEMGVSSFNSELITGTVRFSGSASGTAERAILLPSIDYAKPDMVILSRNYLQQSTLVETFFAGKTGLFNLKPASGSTRGFEQFYLIHANDENNVVDE